MFVNLDKKILSVSPLCYLQKAWFGIIFLQKDNFSKKKKKKIKWLASRFWEFTNFYIYFFSAKEFGKKKKIKK